MWTIFKVFIELITILLLFYVLVFWPQGMWDLRSPTRDRTPPPALEGKVLTAGPPGKSPLMSILKQQITLLPPLLSAVSLSSSMDLNFLTLYTYQNGRDSFLMQAVITCHYH